MWSSVCQEAIIEHATLSLLYVACNGKDWERNDFWLLGVERVSLRMAWRGMRGRKGDHAELSVEQSCGKSAKRSLPATTPELRLLWLFFNATKVEISLENVGSA